MSADVKQRAKKVMPVSPGRPRGVPNKTTALLKDAILRAAELAGDKLDGEGHGLIKYLEAQSVANAGPFIALLGKVLPLQITGEGDGPLVVQVVKFGEKE